MDEIKLTEKEKDYLHIYRRTQSAKSFYDLTAWMRHSNSKGYYLHGDKSSLYHCSGWNIKINLKNRHKMLDMR